MHFLYSKKAGVVKTSAFFAYPGGRDAITFFKKFAEMVSIIIADSGSNFLNTAFGALFQKFLCTLQADVDEMMDGRVTGFALKNAGDIKWT